jgi:hypothetical protein
MIPPTPWTRDTCPDRAKHTPCPSGYLAWWEWADRKAKTHDQQRCPTCLLWAIWTPRTPSVATPPDNPMDPRQ